MSPRLARRPGPENHRIGHDPATGSYDEGVTYNQPQQSGANSVSAGGASDVKTFAAAALLTFSAGLLVLLGVLVIGGGFGGFLGIIAAVLGVVWWRSINQQLFPRDLPTASMVGVTAAAAGLGLAVWALI